MRKYTLFTILLLCLAVRGQTITDLADIDLGGLPQPTTAKALRYWFDDDAVSQQILSGFTGTYTLDVRSLTDGLHTLHFQVIEDNGEVGDIASGLFMKFDSKTDAGNVKADRLFYWFDDDTAIQIMDISHGVQLLDASSLQDGLHTLHYQVLCDNRQTTSTYSSVFLRVNNKTDVTVAHSLRYWFDDDQVVTEVGISDGVQLLDASMLTDGLHTVHFQIIDNKGMVGSIMSSVFMKMDAEERTTAQSLRYWFDDDASSLKVVDVAKGTQTLDVSNLITGLHTLCYQLIDSDGKVGSPVTRLFMKDFDKLVAEGENRITKYKYWLNDRSENMQTVELNGVANPYELITLLSVQKMPIRSKQFHFEVTDGQPTMYADNTFHIRFHDTVGYFIDGDKSFVDYRVKQVVEPAGEMQTTQTFERVSENDIRWYTVQLLPGDTVAFRMSQPATLQLFAPSGEEVFRTSESASMQWDGTHVWKEGTYYLAVHDVTGSQSSMTLDYLHMDKYDVVDWDVHTVGNGGCSTITFKGNGFRDLYAVDLFNADGDSIHSVHIGHERDAETSVVFDFNGAELGEYDAVFRFTDENKVFTNIVTVEEAVDIDIETEVQYASSYLKGTKNPYRITLTNKGNMTAYDVPVIIGAFEEEDGALNYIKVDGYSLSKMYDEVWKDSLPTALYDSLRYSTLEHGDMCYFIKVNNSTYEQGYPYAKITSLFPSIPPYSSLHLIVSIMSSQTTVMYVWVANPEQSYPTTQYAKAKNRMTKIQCDYYKKMYAKCIENVKKKYGDNADYAEDSCIYGPPPSCGDPPGGGTSTPQPPSDPNDIYGYLSDADSKFIADTVARVNYIIEFENDTAFATAAAHKIVVKDTLDRRYFDLEKFMPTGVRIGSKEEHLSESDIYTNNGRTSFVKTIDMRPEIYAIAQVEGDYDHAQGIATWTFTSLDPMSMEPTDELMQGILPVNWDGTSGIGEVMFEVGVKPNKGDGTEVKNRAGIVFDYEEPIITPTWVNIVDAVAPTSSITDVTMENDTIARLHVTAQDNLSGVWYYDVYAQYGQGAMWVKVGEHVTDSLFDFRVYEDIDYGFCVLAVDSAGNVEKKKLEREWPQGQIPTSITNPDTETETTAEPVYDLGGRQVPVAQEGIYVQKGRKRVFRRK